MSVACSVELWAESMAPSRTCAQFALTSILTMLIRVCADGAQDGASKGAGSPAPIHTHTKPPASSERYAVCFTFAARQLAAGSDGISTTLPSTSIFQP